MLRPLVLSLCLASWPGSCGEPADSGREGRPKELVVVLLGDAAALEDGLREHRAFRRGASRLEDWSVTLRSADSPRLPRGAETAVFATLLPASEPVRDLVRGLPVDLSKERLELSGAAYDPREVSLAVRVPGVEGERWLVASAHPERLLDAVGRTLARAAGGQRSEDGPDREVEYEVEATPWIRRTGTWRAAGEAWEIDPSRERDDFAERERWLASLRPLQAGPVRLLVPAGSEASPEMEVLARDLGAAAAAMAPRVPLGGDQLRARPVTVAVEPDHVAQVRHAGALGPVVVGGSVGLLGGLEPPDLHVVYHPDDLWAYRHAVAGRLLERAGIPEERSRWLSDGAALWLTRVLPEGQAGLWYGRPYAGWLPDVAASGLLPPARYLLAAGEPAEGGGPARDDASEPLWTPVAAGVVDRLEGETALERLSVLGPDAVTSVLARMAAEARPAPASPGPGTAPPARFLRGVSLAMWNFSLEAGYHAPAVGERLDRLAGLGADAVSLMPFAFQPRPDAPGMRFLNDTPTSETDAGLVHAARVARGKGFTVLWKPHVWVGHGSWPGEIEMASDEDWQAWWRSYRRYVLHHALLAGYAGAEMFAVGVELERTVERREDWERLIRDVRRFYPGAVTYAANWGSGAERVSFWSSLDAAGVDAYYPLSDAAEADDTVLRRGAEEAARRLEAIARRAGKPLVLTEVGFPARKAAWREPHAEGGELSPEDQARAYGALFEALRGRPWLHGVFVWKAFSGERESWPGGDRPDFRFLGRPSEAVVAEFFRAMEREPGLAPGRP